MIGVGPTIVPFIGKWPSGKGKRLISERYEGSTPSFPTMGLHGCTIMTTSVVIGEFNSPIALRMLEWLNDRAAAL